LRFLGHRDVVIETYGTWPSPEEMELRTVVEQAVAASGVADVLGADAGRGSVSLWVRLKRRDDA
jgi:acyl-coenzyme A synthetase/AMP-(fatty) acid ligase